METRRAGAVEVSTQGDVVRATIDRPQARNAIDDDVVQGLEAAVARALDAEARVLVVRGAGGNFCAGADLRQLRGMTEDPRRLDAFMRRLSAVLDAIESAPFASVAVVEGFAVAGGCELLLACDLTVATIDAQIGDRHAEYGLVPAAGGSVRLTRTLPKARSRYLLLTGELITGDEAADWGLVTWAVPREEVDHVVGLLVDRLRGLSRDALATVKSMIADAEVLDHDEAVARERRRFLDHVAGSPDVPEGLAAFTEHRAPQFRP